MKNLNKTISIALSAVLVTFTLTGCDFMGTVNTDLTLKDENEAVAQISQITPVDNPDIITDPETNTNPDINTNPDNTDPYNPDDVTVIDDRDPLDIYMSFLEGNDKAYIDFYPDYFDEEEKYSYDEIIEGYNAYLAESWGEPSMQIKEVDYAIIDCGNDGFPELCVCFTSNNDGGYDEVNDYFIIVAFDWGLSFADHYNTYYRSMGEINKYGVFHNYGAFGANRGYDSYERVNKYGEHEFIYDCSSELSISDAIIPYYNLPSYIELPDDYPTEIDYGKLNRYTFSFMEYTVDMYDDKDLEDEYYRTLAYLFNDDNGNVYFPEEKYAVIYDGAGINVTDGDGIIALINERMDMLGITEEEMLTVDEDASVAPDWKVWEDFVHEAQE